MPTNLRAFRPLWRAALGLGIAILPLVGGEAAPAQDSEPTTAEQILDRYVEVTGGEEAYQALETERMTASVEVVGTDLEGQFESFRKAPDRYLRKDSVGSAGETVRGTDGTTAWEVNPTFGPRLLEGVEKAQFVREAAFNNLLKWRALYRSVERTGEQNVGGEACHVVVQTPETGGPETTWYGKESGLMRKTALTAETVAGPMEVELTFDDYKEFGGVKLPTSILMSVMGTEIRITIQEVEHNVEIPDATFAPPEPVQALLDADHGSGS